MLRLGSIWEARRPDWECALKGLYSKQGMQPQKVTDVFTSRVLAAKPWTLTMYQQLVAYVDLLCDRKWRRWQSLGIEFSVFYYVYSLYASTEKDPFLFLFIFVSLQTWSQVSMTWLNHQQNGRQ